MCGLKKYSLFLLDTAGHTRTRRGPDVARGPDVVHHCCRPTTGVLQKIFDTSTISRHCDASSIF